MGGHGKIRVLVVDDSALMRKMIPLILEKDPDIEVIATAVDGRFALNKAARYRPDVITLDIDMPGMDGLTTLKHIVREYGIPVVIVSSLTSKGAEMTMKAFELGAMEVVAKPVDAISVHIRQISEELIGKVVAVSASSTSKLHLERQERAVETDKAAEEAAEKETEKETEKEAARASSCPTEFVVAVGISTGGPNALSCLLPQLPKDFPAAMLVVQHMPPGFTEVFANRLNKMCSVEVKEARDGDLVLAGRVLIAPGTSHMKIKKTPLNTIVVLSSRQPVNGHRPSADVLFNSVAEEYGPKALGVIMTGMGEDGARGIGEIKRAGGRTIAQDEKSCIVFGMPKAAIKSGCVDRVVPLDEMMGAIMGEITLGGGAKDLEDAQYSIRTESGL